MFTILIVALDDNPEFQFASKLAHHVNQGTTHVGEGVAVEEKERGPAVAQAQKLYGFAE